MHFCIIQLAAPRGIAQDVQHLKQEVSAVVWRTLPDETTFKEVFLKATATLENIDINMQIPFFKHCIWCKQNFYSLSYPMNRKVVYLKKYVGGGFIVGYVCKLCM